METIETRRVLRFLRTAMLDDITADARPGARARSADGGGAGS
jgi:hypothetical protein